MRQISYALVFSVLATTAVVGQEAGPRLLSTSDSSFAPIRQAAVDVPHARVDRQGKVRGASVTERLGEIRRRAVDADISRPFAVTDETNPELIELHGALPAVPRRVVKKAEPKPISTRLKRQQTKIVATQPKPTETQPVAKKPVPQSATVDPPAQNQSEAVQPTEKQTVQAPLAEKQPASQPVAKPPVATPPVLPPVVDQPVVPQTVAKQPALPQPSEPQPVEPEPTKPEPTVDPTPEVMVESVTTPAPVIAPPTKPLPAPVKSEPQPAAQPEPPLVQNEPKPEAAPEKSWSASQPALDVAVQNAVPDAPSEPQPEVLPVLPAQPDPEPVAAPDFVARRVTVKTQEIKKESDILLSNQVPALSFETAGPKQIRIGREAKYRVSMYNRGNADARDVIVTVNLPAWAEVTRTNATVGTPNVELDRDRSYNVTWELGQLAMNGKEDLLLGIIPRDSRPFDLAVGWTLAAAQSSTQIEVQEPKLVMAVNGARDVLYGETSIYTIVLSNPGTGDAENVTLSLMPLTPHQELAGTRKVGTVKAGERKTIELELTAHQAGKLQVRAIANAEGGLRADAAQDVIVRRANLDVAIIGPPRNFAGTEATYKIRIENTGDATAEQALASAVIPTSAGYIASNDGGKFDSVNNRIQWQVGTLRPGAVRMLEFRCVLEAAGENRIDISAMADGDLQISKAVATQVEALADLKLYVNDPKGPISVGQDSAYEVKIVNRGTKTAEDINVIGYFSDGIEPVDVRGWRGMVSTGQVQFEPIGNLSPGQEIVFRITARAETPGNHVFRAEVQCSNPETRLAAEEWTKYFGIPAAPETRQASRPRQIHPRNATPHADGQGQFYLPEIRR